MQELLDILFEKKVDGWIPIEAILKVCFLKLCFAECTASYNFRGLCIAEPVTIHAVFICVNKNYVIARSTSICSRSFLFKSKVAKER